MQYGLGDEKVALFLEWTEEYFDHLVVYGALIVKQKDLDEVKKIIKNYQNDRDRREWLVYRRFGCDKPPDCNAPVTDCIEYDTQHELAVNEIRNMRTRPSECLERLKEKGVEFEFYPHYYVAITSGW